MENSENFSAPTKATSGRPGYSPVLYQIQSAIAKLLVSFPGQNPERSSQGDSVVLRLKSVMMADVSWFRSIHSFIPEIYIAPLQETYSEALSVQLRSKRSVLRSLQKEEMLLTGIGYLKEFCFQS